MYLKLSQLLSDYHRSIALYFFLIITNDAKKMPTVITTIMAWGGWGGAKHKEPLLWPGGRSAPKKRTFPPPTITYYCFYNDYNIVLPRLLMLFPPCNFTHDIGDSRNLSTYVEVETQILIQLDMP